MAEDSLDEADNENTRIVRRPGPANLPVGVAPIVAQPATPTPAALDATVIAPTPAALANVRGEPASGAPVVAPPVPNDHPRPAMTPPPPRAPVGAPASVAPAGPPQGARAAEPVPIVVRPGPATPLPAGEVPSAVRAEQLQPRPVPSSTPAVSAESKLPAAETVKAPAQAASPALPQPLIDPVVGWLVVVKGPGRGIARTITTGRNAIGSASSQAIPLDFGDPAIAPQGHAYIVYDDEAREFLVEDGKQKVVVRLNGRLLTETMPIGDGDELRIGATTLRFVALCGPDFDWGEDEKSSHVATPVAASADVVVVVADE